MQFLLSSVFLSKPARVWQSFLTLVITMLVLSMDTAWPEEHPVLNQVFQGISASTGEPALHTVRGQVALPDSTPLVDVQVSVGELTTRTDELGFYSFLLPDGVYTIAFAVSSTEIPEHVEVRVNGADVFVNLYPLKKYTLRGRVLGREGPLKGMSVLAGSKTAVTDDQGWFSFMLPDREYLLELDAGLQYFPSSRAVRVNGADVTVDDFHFNRVVWNFAAVGEVKSPPLVGPDGIVYLITSQGEPSYIHALAPDGKLQAKYDIDSNIVSAPVQGIDGTIYIATFKSILALNPDLTPRWNFPVQDYGASTPPALGMDGTIYFSCFNRVYALNPDGTVKWEYAVNDYLHSPTIGKDEIIIFKSESGALYAIYSNGTLLKKYEHGEVPDATVTGGSDAAITYICRNGVLSALQTDGTIKWEFPGIDSYTYAWVYPPTGEIWTWKDGYPLGVNPDGTLKWRHRAPFGTPAYGPAGRIYMTYVEYSHQTTTFLYAIDMVEPEGIVTSAESGFADNALGNDSNSHPEQIQLFQNSPNPFNLRTIISFILPGSGPVNLRVYSISGQKLRELLSEHCPAGINSVFWDGRDDSGAPVSSGVYLCRLRQGKHAAVGRMILVK